MSDEEIRKIATDIMNDCIMQNLDSSLIFKYVDELERERNMYKFCWLELSVRLNDDKCKYMKADPYGIYELNYTVDQMLNIIRDIETEGYEKFKEDSKDERSE